MKQVRNYADSPCPLADAFSDVKEWFGPERWAKISPMMQKVKDPEHFALAASFGGVEGLPVRAWYEHYNGGGSWERAQKKETSK